MQLEELKDAIVTAIDDMKGEEIAILDVRGMTDITDYMIIANGNSDRHVRAIADKLVGTLRDRGLKPSGVEGEQTGEWILVDYGDIVVHVMRPQTRSFYDLEKLWSKDVEELVRLNREKSAE